MRANNVKLEWCIEGKGKMYILQVHVIAIERNSAVKLTFTFGYLSQLDRPGWLAGFEAELNS